MSPNNTNGTTSAKNSNVLNKRLSTLLQETKKIQWKEIKGVLLSSSTIKEPGGTVLLPLDSLRKQAIHKACLDPKVCPETMKLLLRHPCSSSGSVSRSRLLEVEETVKCILTCVRCENVIALSCLIEEDVSILYRDITKGRRNTILHLVCEKHGWSPAIQYLFQETMNIKNTASIIQQQDHQDSLSTPFLQDHKGMFQLNAKNISPFQLALQAGGCELFEEIAIHLRDHYPYYFANHIQYLPEIIAEYCTDMSLLEEFILSHPGIVSGKANNNNESSTTTTTIPTTKTPLHYACYYQNKDMIYTLLKYYSTKKKERRNKLIRRLLTVDKETNVSPLEYLALGLGTMDAGNAFSCIQVIMQIIKKLPIVHLIIDKMWGPLTKQQNCYRTITRVIETLQINLCSMDDHGRTILSLVILKMTSVFSNEGTQILDYLLTNSKNGAATTRDKQKRLPLHVACENGLPWTLGLQLIVDANFFALEEVDPKMNLVPFALAATSVPCHFSSYHLSTIYQLLRSNPSVLL